MKDSVWTFTSKAARPRSAACWRPAAIVCLSVLLASSAASAETSSLVISLQDIDCQSCGQAVVKMLKREKGIRAASFDLTTAEVTLELGDLSPSTKEILQLVQRAGFKAVEGAGKGKYEPAVDFAENLDVAWLSRAGEAVEIEAHLVPGKVTVIDFYALWCGPCRDVDREMKKILAASDDVALRKINVVDWSSPIAKQELKNVAGLPYVEVYGKSGKKIAQIQGLHLDRLHKAIEKGRTE